MTTKVEICGVNTSKLPVLSEQEKKVLFEKIKQGDMQARQDFIYGNLRLVLSILRRFNNRGENIDDLFQIGCIGLIKALDNFDTSHDVKFSTYAVPMIIGEIRRYLRDNNAIRVSRSMRDIAYKALAVKERLTAINGKEPTVEEIAKELMDYLERGCTYYKSEGAFSRREGKTFICVVDKKQFHKAKKIIYAIDPTAFLIVSEAKEVYGEGFLDSTWEV